jgi:D-alanyl-D-alanine dipeptidase
MPDAVGVTIAPMEEPMICLSETCQEVMVFQPKYWERKIPGAVAQVYVRKTVADMLLAAARLLPDGYKFKIFDAWRPVAVQKALFGEYYAVLQQRFQGENKSEAELKKMAAQFVSYPSEDPDCPSLVPRESGDSPLH